MPIPEGTSIGTVVIHEALADEAGERYIARQPGLQRKVLVRVVREQDADASAREALQRAAYLGSRVAHPNVVGTYDYFRLRGDHYLVTEHVDGPSLAEALERVDEVPPEVAGRIALEIARGLEELHAAGIYLTALCPENVLISRRGQIKLSGLDQARDAREDPAALERAPQAYDAPEFGRGEPIGPASDVYSLGALLYHLMEGEPPPHEAPRRMPRVGLQRVIASCLASDPAARPTLEELRRRLENELQDRSPASCRAEIGAWLWDARILAPAGDSPPRFAARPPQETIAMAPLRSRVPRWGVAAVVGVVLVSWLAVRLMANGAPESQAVPEVAAAAPDPPATIVFDASPWAEIQVDDQAPFLTPRATPVELTPGSHEVRFRHPSYAEVSQRINVDPGETRVVRHTFAPAGAP
jgi:hypothetical protein